MTRPAAWSFPRRLLPRSLAGRLMVTALAAIVLGVSMSAVVIAGVMERVVMHDLDLRLDTQIALLARDLPGPAATDAAWLRRVDLPPFDRPHSGWAWEIVMPDRTLRSASRAGVDLPMPPTPDAPSPGHASTPYPAPPPPPDSDDARDDPAWPAPRPMDGRDNAGRRLHYRLAVIEGPDRRGRITIVAAAPRAIIERPLRAIAQPLLECMGALTALLLAALFVQVRIGLRPLARLQAMVSEIRAGRSARIAITEPRELLPLVEELDALIVANARAIAHARMHVANLAHGLKTPLAILRLDLAHGPDGMARPDLAAQIDRMERQIRHHLGRARAAPDNDIARAGTCLFDHLDDLAHTLGRLHADTPVTAAIDIAHDLRVRCDAQDLDELLGNILDNAWRHARRRIVVGATRAGRQARISVEDDGPGMTDADIARVLDPRSVDERGSRPAPNGSGRHGIGLAISRELVELHGGSMSLRRAGIGGLGVEIALPCA